MAEVVGADEVAALTAAATEAERKVALKSSFTPLMTADAEKVRFNDREGGRGWGGGRGGPQREKEREREREGGRERVQPFLKEGMGLVFCFCQKAA